MLAPMNQSKSPPSMSHSGKSFPHKRPHPDSAEEEQKSPESTSASSLKLAVKEPKGEYKSKLRPRKIANYKDQFDISSPGRSDPESSDENNGMYMYGACVLPNSVNALIEIIERCDSEIKSLEAEFMSEEHSDEEKKPASQYPDKCIPIATDVMTFNFAKLALTHKQLTGQLFDVVMMDPPWQLSSSNPTRGVAIAYDTLTDAQIQKLPIPCLQDNGFLFIWTINAKFSLCFSLMEAWGYAFCDEICWVKQSVNGKIAKGHGFYLQHSKETCLVGVKGNPWGKAKKDILEDCIFSRRRGQSQKPNEIYELIEALVPNGYYMEVFGRRNNLRDGWVTVGNEL